MFRKNLAALAPMLNSVEFVAPHLRYTGSLNLDLGGGHIVELHEFGGAHSLGDQGILVRGSASVLFTGDLVEEGTFGVLGDSDSHTVPWLRRASHDPDDPVQRYRPVVLELGWGQKPYPQLEWALGEFSSALYSPPR